jgi:ABC-2 type transport system ATP-binding protein
MTTPSLSAITATGLRRAFGDHVVLDGIDLNVPRGTVFSLLGANGAGKTTTVKILSMLIRREQSILTYSPRAGPTSSRLIFQSSR